MMRLYTYFRSSAVFRVRIALNLKGLSYEAVPVHLLRDGGQQHAPEFTQRNPSHLVPVLDDDGRTITQSLAIIEYLDEQYPTPTLLPKGAEQRAKVRALAFDIACDIHPLNNLRVMQYLATDLAVDEDRRNAWSRHWIAVGFAAIERKLREIGSEGDYCFGNSATLADCCLVPQVFNAIRLKCPLDDVPTIQSIYEQCMKLPAFERAAPANQPDAE